MAVEHPDSKEHPTDIKFLATDFTDTEDRGMFNATAVNLQVKSMLDCLEINLCDTQKKDFKTISKYSYSLLEAPLPAVDAPPEISKRPIVIEFLLFYTYKGKMRPFRVRLAFLYLTFTESLEFSSSRRMSMQNISMLKNKMVQNKE